MPANNNQKFESAAARLVKLPLVRSACSSLSVLYSDTKCSHPNLRSVCEILESRVTAISSAACHRVTPVMVKLGPHISVVNNVACKSLDWLETTFPVLHTPTEQVFAVARSKMNEIQDVVSIAANETVGCVQHTLTWLVGRIQQEDDKRLVERAVSVAGAGLDSALIMTETLIDHVLPPSERDKEAEAHLLEGFEAATPRRSYRVRLLSLADRLCRRTYHMVGSRIQYFQVMESLSRSSCLVQDVHSSWVTLNLNIQQLPQYLVHQLVSAFFFISQMYNLSCPRPRQHQSNGERAHLNAAETPTHRVVQLHPQAKTTSRVRRHTKASPFENWCDAKGRRRRSESAVVI